MGNTDGVAGMEKDHYGNVPVLDLQYSCLSRWVLPYCTHDYWLEAVAESTPSNSWALVSKMGSVPEVQIDSRSICMPK